MARKELQFQSHIIDSYKLDRGFGKKWASDMQVGNPDLVLSFPRFGVHLSEVKHRPDWTVGRTYKNPLTRKQVECLQDYWNADGNIMAMVVLGTQALGSTLCLIWPLNENVTLTEELSFKYNTEGIGKKYPIRQALEKWEQINGWQR